MSSQRGGMTIEGLDKKGDSVKTTGNGDRIEVKDVAELLAESIK